MGAFNGKKTYTNGGLTSGTQYCYRIRALRDLLQVDSAEVCATTFAVGTPPAAPTGVAIIKNELTPSLNPKLRVSW